VFDDYFVRALRQQPRPEYAQSWPPDEEMTVEGKTNMFRHHLATPSATLYASVCFGLLCGSTHASIVVGHHASFQGIGFLDEQHSRSEVHGLSSNGKVVLGSYSGGSFLWTPTLGITHMIDNLHDGQWNYPLSLSGNGKVVVGYADTPAHSQGLEAAREAFRWTAATGTVGLGDISGHAVYQTSAWGVSFNGSVVAGWDNGDTTGERGYLWTQNNGMRGLTDPPTTPSSRAYAMTPNAKVIVGTWSPPGFTGYEAVRWVAGKGMQELGDLPGGYRNSIAKGVSANAKVVVGYSASKLGNQAFRWTAKTGMQNLGGLSAKLSSSEAVAASADGSIIVGTGLNRNGGAAFIWDHRHGMRALKSVLLKDFHLSDVRDWDLINATSISADGTTIGGNGYDPDGNWEGWVVHLGLPRLAYTHSEIAPEAWLSVTSTVPEPSVAALLVAGPIVLLSRRPRQRSPQVSLYQRPRFGRPQRYQS
jgi:probable HAF family extracellular repeat protein